MVWLVELVSVLVSDAAKDATVEQKPFFFTRLSTDAEDARQSEEGEILLVQQKIGEKVWRNYKPIKFPRPSPQTFHMIVVDVRGFGITGGDLWDYREIAYGHSGLVGQHQVFRHYWRLPNGDLQPILGLFDKKNTHQRAAKVIQDRIHFLGFCADEAYEPGSIADKTYSLGNPWLFGDDSGALAAYERYPLRARLQSAQG